MARERTKMIASISRQAMMEGVMIQSPHKAALAAHMPDNVVSTEETVVSRLRNHYGLLRSPVLHGVVGFTDTLSVGYKAPNILAEKSGLEDNGWSSKFDQQMQRIFGDKLMNAIMTVSTILSVLITMGLFFWLPTWLFSMGQTYSWGSGFAEWRTVFEGSLKIAIFVAYVAFCVGPPDIGRMFQYHGVERRTIFCYENEEGPTVGDTRKYQYFHPCYGTGLMVAMLLFGIAAGHFTPLTNPLVHTVVKLLYMPPLMGVGCGLIRVCGKYDNLFTRIISASGMWMQRLTTREPDDLMIEVAISAMEEVVLENGEDRVVR